MPAMTDGREGRREERRTPYATIAFVFMLVMMGGTFVIYRFSTTHMGTLKDATMTLAFLSAPLFAYLNCRAIAVVKLPKEMAPPRWLSVLSWVGLAFLTCFSILYLVVHFGYGK